MQHCSIERLTSRTRLANSFYGRLIINAQAETMEPEQTRDEL
jgi:hypothetical protein